MSAHNMEAVKCLSGCLKHIKYIPKILLRMSKAQATVGDWSALYKTLYHAVYIGDIAKAQPNSIDIFRKIANAFTEDLHKCVNLICKTIDFEESKIRKRFIVLPHIDKNLDEKKRMFNGLPDLMGEVARQEIETLSSDIKECVVSYLPEIGYLLVIELPEGKTVEEYQNIEGITFMFHSNNQCFYKSPKTIELDNVLGDTQLDIMDTELKIMHRLQATVLECTSVMLSIMELAAELDCLMALATCACEFGFVKPTLVQENIIHIKGSRHPLQELCCNIFVPNDVMLGGSSSKMKLITGPNACGKSVYLKQVALIVFMAHVGSFVPANEAEIGPCDAIFSRLKSVESTAVHMSTFMQDLSQVSQALRSASSKSLVIMDEFGKGTESTDGLSLLTAVIKYWIGRQSECPFTLIATHFHSIIQQRLLPTTSHIEYLTFDTVTNEEELVFLYELIPGHTSSSYACKCAAQVGIPGPVVKRGQQVSDLLCQFKTVPVEDDSIFQARRQMHARIVDRFLDLNLNEDNVNRFLKDFVLKLYDDSVEAAKELQHVEEDECGKKGSHSIKEGTSLSKPSTSKAKESTDHSVSKQDTQQVKSSRITLRKKDDLYGMRKVNTETERPPGHRNEIMNKEGSCTSFIDTPTFPINSMTHFNSMRKPTEANYKQTEWRETNSFRDDDNIVRRNMNMHNGDKENSSRKHVETGSNIHRHNSQPKQSQKITARPNYQRLPLFATPNSPKLYNPEEYYKSHSSTSTTAGAAVKRKLENTDITTTYDNPPTPFFNFLNKNPVSATSTKTSYCPSTIVREESSLDGCGDTDRDIKRGGMSTTDPSYSGRNSDKSGRAMETISTSSTEVRRDATSTETDENRTKADSNSSFTTMDKNRTSTPSDSSDGAKSFSNSSLTSLGKQTSITSHTGGDSGYDKGPRQASSLHFSLGKFFKSKMPLSANESAIQEAGTSSSFSFFTDRRVKLKEESTDLPSSGETTEMAHKVHRSAKEETSSEYKSST